MAADSDDPTGPAIKWVDTQQRTWGIELPPGRVILRSGTDAIDLPQDHWDRDILVAPHGRDYIIRIETFDFGAGFVVSAEQAKPLLAHIGARPGAAHSHAAADEASPVVPPLLWPRVSHLAVWALISSSLVFIPVLGLLPALITVILLILHRKKVRRAGAWRHSRALCTVAFIFLVAGLLVSALATWGIAINVRSEFAAASSPEPTLLAPPNQPVTAAAVPLAFLESLFDRNINWGLLAAAMIVILFSLSVHEAGHGITAWWLGDDFARRQGRVTLNPIAHIDPIGTVLFPFILFLMNVGVFGWAKPVPVRTECLRSPRRDHILVSLAGPGSNLLIAAGSLLLLLGLGCAVGIAAPQASVTNFCELLEFDSTVSASGFALAPVFAAACTILRLSFLINVILAFFNLIPIPPLDGSWVLEHLFPNTLGRLYERIRPYGFLLFLGLIYTGVLQYLILPVLIVLVPAFLLLNWCTAF